MYDNENQPLNEDAEAPRDYAYEQAEAIRWLGRRIDLSKVEIKLRWHNPEEATVGIDAYHANQTKLSLKRIKSSFGPLKPYMSYASDGETSRPLWHNGEAKPILQFGEHSTNVKFSLVYYGLFQCNIERYEETVEHVPTVEYQPAHAKATKKPVYYCGPAPLPEE